MAKNATSKEISLHKLHKIIAKRLAKQIPESCKLLVDYACGGSQRLPLFLDKPKSRKTTCCNVDMLVLQNHTIRVIIEIEETDIKPTQVCGKFLTSVLGLYFIHKCCDTHIVEKSSDGVLFLQVVYTPNRGMKSVKYKQLNLIENRIQKILPLNRVTHYKLLQVKSKDNHYRISTAVNCVKNYCANKMFADPSPQS